MIQVSEKNREALLNQKGKVIWFTGLPCSGKTTLATHLEFELNKKGLLTYLLDADVVRLGLNSDLNFTAESRNENIRRIAEVSALFVDAGVIVMCAFISPQQISRDNAKKIIGDENYFEVFVDCPIKVCEERDVKGMYKMARGGLIKEFTGVDSPYELPKYPNLTLKTAEINLEQSVAKLLELVLPLVSK